jgi:hypothetical protein
MGGKDSSREADIGEILAPGLEARIDRPRRAVEEKGLIRAGG